MVRRLPYLDEIALAPGVGEHDFGICGSRRRHRGAAQLEQAGKLRCSISVPASKRARCGSVRTKTTRGLAHGGKFRQAVSAAVRSPRVLQAGVFRRLRSDCRPGDAGQPQLVQTDLPTAAAIRISPAQC